MTTRKLAAVLTLGAALVLPTLALATTGQAPNHCVLREHAVTSVTPYKVLEHTGRGSHERLAGAQLNVRAEPGLTAQWLQLTIQDHLAKMNGTMANCPLDLKDVQVSVDSAGAGFAVKIAAKNPAQAKEVLQRAQLMFK